MEFKGKKIVITGASSGIGEALAQNLHKRGAIIVGIGLEDVQKPYQYYQADITNVAEVNVIFAQIKEDLGALDGLVNCAGITQVGTLETLTHEQFDREFAINVTGVFNICKAAIGLLKGRASSIVNVASDLGVKPIPQRIGYCPSKAALIMLTKCIAVDYAPNVRANCILPGVVETPMTADRFIQEPELRDIYAQMYLAKRIGTIDDMTNAITFLLSAKSSFITGDQIAVCSGGQL
ncbi:MAG: SDR family NAD(P)-dependent oxidoreductase [Culicoidibacterales bacterium]